MNWRVLYHPDVRKVDLPKIPKNLQARIRKAIELRLSQDPILAGEPLRKSLKGYRKLRVGDYRVIYRIEKADILIFIIGNRKEVYRKVLLRVGSKEINEV